MFINKNLLEEQMQIAQDVKKEFAYNKYEGTWSWFDRGEEENTDGHHRGFKTFYEALAEAVEPYMTKDCPNCLESIEPGDEVANDGFCSEHCLNQHNGMECKEVYSHCEDNKV